MSTEAVDYGNKRALSAREAELEFSGWFFTVVGVAILALGVGVATSAGAIDKGHIFPLDGNRFEHSPLGSLSILTCLLSILAPLLGLILIYLGMEEIGRAQQNLKSPPYLKNVQATLVIIGLAVALFGIGMASGATAIHNSSQFSDPDNLRFYDSQAALDAVGTHLTTLTAIGFTLIPMIGGGIAAAGLLPSIPLKIAQWFEARADAKRKADEATATGKINLDGDEG